MHTIQAPIKFMPGVMLVFLLQASFASTAEKKTVIKGTRAETKVSCPQSAIASYLATISSMQTPTVTYTVQACRRSCRDCCRFCNQCIDVTCSTDCCLAIKGGIQQCCDLCGFICALLGPNSYIPPHLHK